MPSIDGTNTAPISVEKIDEVRQLALAGMAHRTIAGMTGVSKASVGRITRGEAAERGRSGMNFRAGAAQRKETERTLTRRRRDEGMERIGGKWRDLYLAIRDASGLATELRSEADDPEFVLALNAVLGRLSWAEDAIVQVRGVS